ncbi:Protein FD [Platanthera guangdongensis]|uniref:Protein FD n=1 Tax=Platanthera guangdongensis TaxID=2320717 RepID=A0ABR2MK48_9ASPA
MNYYFSQISSPNSTTPVFHLHLPLFFLPQSHHNSTDKVCGLCPGGENCHKNRNIEISSSCSRSHSSSSSSVILPCTTPKRKTMEEVWKEINMSTLGHYCHPSPPSLSSVETPLPHHKTIEPADHHSFHGMSLPDFLTGPFKDPRCSAASRKRVCDTPSSCNSVGDRRHKRMIKNRESAARSRARKQAYTNEMELEVAQLSEDNAKLKKQNEQVNSSSKNSIFN